MKSKKTKQNSKKNFKKTREKPTHTITDNTLVATPNYSNNFFLQQRKYNSNETTENNLLKHSLGKRTSIKTIITIQLTLEQL